MFTHPRQHRLIRFFCDPEATTKRAKYPNNIRKERKIRRVKAAASTAASHTAIDVYGKKSTR